jgi:hypothetical protein
MPVNSKKKGSKNERGISKLFTEWTGYNFSRTPQSGGLNWHNKISTGGIICIDDVHIAEFTLSIEAKFHNELDFSHLIDGTLSKGTNKVIHFWDQCSKDALHDKKIPCLFMRRNGMKADNHFVAIPLDFLMLLRLSLPEWEPSYGYIAFQSIERKFAILNSEDFFKMPYKILHQVGKGYRIHKTTKRLIKKS